MANEYKLDYTASDINEKLGKIEEKYTAAAKAKVDAIPANPKYTDTVYNDTEIKNRISAVEGKLNGSGSVTFSNVTTTGLTTKGRVEIYGSNPYLDFHHANSNADYTSRIEDAGGAINILAPNGLKLNGSNLKYDDTEVKNRLNAIEYKKDVTLTANTDRIRDVSYTAKYNQLLGAVFVRIYGKINVTMSAGYGYKLFSIDSYLPNSNVALSVKVGSDDSAAITKKASAYAKSSGAINIQPLDGDLKDYDVYITGFWFV